MRTNLFYKVFITYLVIVALAMSMVGLLAHKQLRTSMMARIERELTSYTALINFAYPIPDMDEKVRQLARIAIDPESFVVTLYDSNSEQVTRDLLSAGEKEIFALSVLWGLSKLAKTKMPVIADSLLGRLDDSHVKTVATIFLPIAAEQVIVLSHSREVDKELYATMKPHVNAEYLLSYDKAQKISPGYFFEVA